jgi:hypothetical protein
LGAAFFALVRGMCPELVRYKKFEFFLNGYLHRTDYSSERLNRLNQPNAHRVAAKSCDTAQRNTSISPVVSSTPLILKGNNAMTFKTLTRRVTCFIQLDDGDQRGTNQF